MNISVIGFLLTSFLIFTTELSDKLASLALFLSNTIILLLNNFQNTRSVFSPKQSSSLLEYDGRRGLGEEFRHNRATINSGHHRRPKIIGNTHQKIILFLFDLKFRRAHIKINKENFFAGWQSMSWWSATAGMTSFFGFISFLAFSNIY